VQRFGRDDRSDEMVRVSPPAAEDLSGGITNQQRTPTFGGIARGIRLLGRILDLQRQRIEKTYLHGVGVESEPHVESLESAFFRAPQQGHEQRPVLQDGSFH